MNEPTQPSSGERQDIISAARGKYGDDNIEIDDDAEMSEAEDGTWVTEWVWIASPRAA
jgi:hypothetical protein